MRWSQGKQRLLEAMLMLAPDFYGRWSSMRTASSVPAVVPTLPAGRQRVLLVDHDFPEVDRDAGSRAIASFAELLTAAGMDVVFWSASTAPSTVGCALLRQGGIITLSRRDTGPLSTWLAEAGSGFIASVLSRPLIAAMYLPVVKRYIAGPHIYYGHDIHHRRLLAMRAVTLPSVSDRWQRLLMQVVEQRLWRHADVALYPSAEEADAVNTYRTARGLAGSAEMFPLWTVGPELTSGPAGVLGRTGLLFVGSMAHAPNVDGLDWFLREVVPHLGALPRLTVVGSGMEAYVPPSSSMLPIDVLGRVDDATLKHCYARTRLVIAPLRFGGGVKGKVLEAIVEGVPCVMTPAAAQGLPGIDTLLPVAGDAADYAHALTGLLTDNVAWVRAAEAARHYLAERYDRARFIQRLRELLKA